MFNMFRPIIANSVGDLGILVKGMPLEPIALDQELGAFNTPLVSAWTVYSNDETELGFIFEYLYVPATWSDGLVKERLRRDGSLHGNIPIAKSMRWVRIVGESGPAFARTKDEAILLFDLDLQLSRVRRELQ